MYLVTSILINIYYEKNKKGQFKQNKMGKKNLVGISMIQEFYKHFR